MLDKAFMRVFFDQLETSSEDELLQKVQQIEKFKMSLPKDCEAFRDANFTLKHLRRELLERQFKQPQPHG